VSSSPQDFTNRHFPWDGKTAHTGFLPGRRGPTIKEWCISFLLFIITTLSVTIAGLFYTFGYIGFLDSILIIVNRPELILKGLQYSIPLIAILLAHEAGHFLACRFYKLQCTPPYFIPVPISITGTLGAFIKIKAPFRDKRTLFDVGLAGPLFGFIVTLPVLYIGISLSQIVPKDLYPSGMLLFGEPLIFRMIGAAVLNYDPATHDMLAHPTAMAGWFGLFITSLNLLPVWQLDGGHLAYAVFGPNLQRKITILVVVLLMLLGFLNLPTPSYLIFGLLLFVLGYRHRFHHPSTFKDWEKLDSGRVLLAITALIILVLCFIPVPVFVT